MLHAFRRFGHIVGQIWNQFSQVRFFKLYLVANKQGYISTEIEHSLPGLRLLGGELDRIDELNIPHIKQGRKIVLTKKIDTTSSKFSRKPGIPQKRPL